LAAKDRSMESDYREYGKVSIIWEITMEPLSSWENILLGAVALLMIFWMAPGVKASIERSKQAKPDWMGFFIPLALVVIFVLFLIAMVR